MMTTSRKNLDRWAREAGYADFDTYCQIGGSILQARNDIRLRIRQLQSALAACNDERLPDYPQPDPLQDGGPAHALILEHPTEPDEPPDPANAHIQGAEHEP